MAMVDLAPGACVPKGSSVQSEEAEKVSALVRAGRFARKQYQDVKERSVRWMRRHFWVSYLTIMLFVMVAIVILGQLLVVPLLNWAVAVSAVLAIAIYLLWIVGCFFIGYFASMATYLWLKKNS